jgi:hypothetical protein
MMDTYSISADSNTVVVKSLLHDDRTFRRIGTKPHQRKDGVDTELAIWQSQCVICGAPFEVCTSMQIKVPERTHDFKITTCAVHRLTGPEKMKLLYTKRHNKRAVFDAIANGKK